LPIQNDPLAGLERDLPLALLPVRLEVRHALRDAILADGREARGMPVLKLRIYPDEIALRDNRDALTASEVLAGLDYWNGLAAPAEGADPVLTERGFWEALVRRVGPWRAAKVRAETDGGYAGPVREGAPRATAELLPDRWLVTGWSGGVRVVETISEVAVSSYLAVGFEQDANTRVRIDPDSAVRFDAETLWLADYDAALAAGMAVTIDLFDGDGRPLLSERTGLDRLLVFGVREPIEDRAPEVEAGALAAQIMRHRERAGASFIRRGTPTNNLDARRAGWSASPHPDAARPTAPAPPAGEAAEALRGRAANGLTLAAALGLQPDTFDALGNARDREQPLARAMTQALFPVTWGELIGTLLMPKIVDGQTDIPTLDALNGALAFAERHVADHVRGGGPLPALLLGRQPYGVLPVTDPSRWRPQPGDDSRLDALAVLLRRLRPFWSHAAAAAPALGDVDAGGQPLDEASRRLLAILCRGPVPHPRSYGVSTVTGEAGTTFLSRTHPDLDLLLDDSPEALAANTRDRVYRMMLGAIVGVPRTARFLDFELQKPLLLTMPAIGEAEGSTPEDYLPRLARARISELRDGSLWAGVMPRDLLCQLLVRALLVANEQSALALALAVTDKQRGVLQRFTHPVEFMGVSTASSQSPAATIATRAVDLVNQAGDAHARQVVTEAGPGGLTFAEIAASVNRLGELRALVGLAEEPLAEMFLRTQNAIGELAAVGAVDELEPVDWARLMGETLATCSTRLDAWVTSIATQRLDRLRRDRPQGLRLGAYGWLLDLPPAGVPPAVAQPAGREGDGLLAAPRRQVGWVHAPSVEHAQTATVLRAAELGRDEGNDGTLARIDLTSARVRTAAGILDAVQNGQPLGAVLGYRLERALQESGRADLIADLRERFPQRSIPTHPDDPEQVVPQDVTDGERVWSSWRAFQSGGEAPPGITREQIEFWQGATGAVVSGVADALDGAVEAVADLLVAEGVHSIVNGQHARAAATLNAAARGDPLPPELTVIRSPRTGWAITHRVLLALPDEAEAVGWSDESPRATACPALERWARGLLGPADGWVVTVELRGANGAPEGEEQVALSALDPPLAALDVIAEATGGVAARSLLADRVIAAAGPRAARIIERNDPFGWERLAAVAGAARELLAAARPLFPADLRKPDEAAAAEDDGIAALAAAKLDQLEGILAGAVKSLEDVLGEPDTAPDAGAVRAALRVLAKFGIPGTAGADDAALVARAPAALAAAQGVLADVTAARTAAEGDEDMRDGEHAIQARLVAVSRALLGPAAIPTLTVAAPENVATRVPDLAADVLELWLAQAARVRTRVMLWEDLDVFAEALNSRDRPSALALQLPAGQTRWLGGPLATRTEAGNPSKNPLRRFARPEGPVTHMVVVGAVSPVTDRIEALVLDEWTEIVAGETVTTGVGLHYDAPDARAPHAVLLALHPDPAGGEPWSWQMTEAMLIETLDLARLRLTEPAELAETAIDEYLPGIYAREGMDGTLNLHSIIMESLAALGDADLWWRANVDIRTRDG
jgi:hypothetical protein